MKKERICFLMPFSNPTSPIGGLKVVLQYASLLSRDGFDIHIVYPYEVRDVNSLTIPRRLVQLVRYIQASRKWRDSGVWYTKNSHIKESLEFSLRYKDVPKADIYIATGVETSDFVSKYPCERKFYFIQGYENWSRTDIQLTNTYRYPLTKIAISKWLQKCIKDIGEECKLVQNGFELDKFFVTNDISLRNPYTICMLYNGMALKNALLGIRALEIVHHVYPQLIVNMFGVDTRPYNLPEWYHYTQQPKHDDLLRIYNDSAIFVGTSNIEGWGLTVGEAMLCGCAIACTDILGYKEMVTDQETGLLSPVNDAETMAQNIISLIKDDSLRIRMARSGWEYLQSFSIQKSYNLFKKSLGIE